MPKTQQPKQLPNGQWTVTLDFGDKKDEHGAIVLNAEGKPIRDQRRKPFPTKKEAEMALAQHKINRSKGTAVAPVKLTLEQHLNNWLARKKADVRLGTYNTYKTSIDVHIVPTIGKTKLEKVNAQTLAGFYTTLAAHGVGTGAMQACHRVLRPVLQNALELGLIEKNESTYKAAQPPKHQARDKRFWNVNEWQRVLDVCDDVSTLGPIWTVALYTAMRRGELLGLSWSDINFEAKEITVWNAALRDKETGEIYLGGVKSDAGKGRTIPVPDDVMLALRRHRAHQNEQALKLGPAWNNEHDLVFPTDVGTLFKPDNLDCDFQHVAKAAGVKRINVHGTRHTVITMWLKQGIPVHVVSRLAGHANPTITLNEYAHVIEGQTEQAASALASLRLAAAM